MVNEINDTLVFLERLQDIRVSVGIRAVSAREIGYTVLPNGYQVCEVITDKAETGAHQPVAKVPCRGAVGM